MKFNNRNVYISPSAKLGVNVKIGDNTTIYDNVTIGDNTIVANDCVIGEPNSSYYDSLTTYANPATTIGSNCLIRSHCIIYSGCNIGNNLITGHRATIRENSFIGDNCLISTLVDIQGNCNIGNFSRLYSNTHIAEKTILGKFVFIYPYTIFTNDPQPPSTTLAGSRVGDFSVIAIHCSVLPGVTIGSHCLIGANSVVSKSIDSHSFAVGSPAVVKSDIRAIKCKEGDIDTPYYPWPYHFHRGMPWSEEGYEKWLKSTGYSE